jgi:hypothetical protein
MHNAERPQGEKDPQHLGSFRRGQHVLYKGTPGFVVAGFNREINRIIVAKDNPKQHDTDAQHLAAESDELADDQDWLRRNS